MMPKPSKITKKGFDPPGNSYIALGSSSNSKTTGSSTNSTTTTTTTTTSASTIGSTNSSSSNSSSNSKNQSNNQTLSNSELKSSSSSSSLLANNKNSSSSSLSNMTNNTNANYLDPKTIKEEITKVLEKEESNEKLTKLIRSIIINIKGTINHNTTNTPKQQQQQQQQQQPDLNYLMALSYATLKRPQLFLKQPALVEELCRNLLFNSKSLQNDSKLNNISTSNNSDSKSSLLKPKPLQPLRAPSPLQTNNSANNNNSGLNSLSIMNNLAPIQPTICNMLNLIYENETSWPEIFVKAYVEDSLGDRVWVDNPMCKEFVDNIQTGFLTKQIPYSVETQSNSLPSSSSSSSLLLQNNNSNSSSDLQSLKNNDDSQSGEFISSGSGNLDSLNDQSQSTENFQNNKKSSAIPRYTSNRSEIEGLLVEMVKSYMTSNTSGSLSKTQQPIKRLPNQIGSTMNHNLVDNKNFLKLLQNTCGFIEIRSIALTKLDYWLCNPKLVTYAQDLLMSVCVNITRAEHNQLDRDLIAQIIKIKPKLKQQQHYLDCIRELIRSNIHNFEYLLQFTVINELQFQQQYYLQQQQQISQQLQSSSTLASKNAHNINLLQTIFSTDGHMASKNLALIMQKVLLQRNSDDYLRSLRILLRDTIKNSRLDFDLIRFTSELVNDDLIKQYYFGNTRDLNYINSTSILYSLAGGLADFTQVQVRERYVNGISDLITMCVLVAITPQIKEAYTRRQLETKDILIKYYMLMSQIQCDTVTWLQSVVRTYEINPPELIKCLYKVLFMVDKPEQCYTIDNWPSEQEKSTMFRVVSEIPVLSETLHQVLALTLTLPEPMHLHMLCVEESLLKTAALVHIRNIYTFKLTKIDIFIRSLFNICLYKYQVPVTLVVSVLYWRAWQILLIISALDPKGFGITAWEKYPTLRLLMEMIMTDDYNYPPQSSITEEVNAERFRSIEQQVCALEKQQILEFENSYESKQNSVLRTEQNSKLIGQVMKFDPTGPPRRPIPDTIQCIRNLNSEYKLGQLLCKCRQPDFLLSLIKRQNSKLSLPWLSSLIESNSNDCLEIMPIQCICEFVWNLLSGTVEEISLKKQINIDQLLNRIKSILTSTDLSDSVLIQQIKDTFDYFLQKLCSDKVQIRSGSLKILHKLFISNNILEKFITPQQLQQLQQQIQQSPVDLPQLIDVFKKLSAFDLCLKPLLIEYFRRALIVETNPDYLNQYVYFLFEQLIIDYKQQIELESSLKMEFESVGGGSGGADTISIQNEPFRKNYNQIAEDLSAFFFNRSFYLNTISLLKYSQLNLLDRSDEQIKPHLVEIRNLKSYIIKYCSILVQLNQSTNLSNGDAQNDSEKLTPDDCSNIKVILKSKQPFDRNNLSQNSYILIELVNGSVYLYIHEKSYNLIVYFLILYVKLSVSLDMITNESHNNQKHLNNGLSEEFDEFNKLIKIILGSNYLNCKLSTAVNSIVKENILKLQLGETHAINGTEFDGLNEEFSYETICSRFVHDLVDSIDELRELIDLLSNKYGLSYLSICALLNRIEVLIDIMLKSDQQEQINSILKSFDVNSLHEIVNLYLNRFKNNPKISDKIGRKFLDYLQGLNDSKMDVDSPKSNQIFSFKSLNVPTSTEKAEITLNNRELIENTLNMVQSQIDNLKKKRELKRSSSPMTQDEPIEDIDTPASPNQSSSLTQIISLSSNQNLELNLNKKLNELSSNDERILTLAQSILDYEIKQDNYLKRSKSNSKIIKENRTPQKTDQNKSDNQIDSYSITYKRCIVDILLDYFCHFDPQIINKQFQIEYRLLFELRKSEFTRTVQTTESQLFSTSAITQTFLLALFTHQASWKKLYDCVLFLLDNHTFFSDKTFSLNPTIVLDFLSSLIHIPELWKGTESKILQKYDEEAVLNLKKNQICCIMDYIIEEMYFLYEKTNKNSKSSTNEPDNIHEDPTLIGLKYKLNKRIQLLKHFFRSAQIKKEKLFKNLIDHLKYQKQIINKLIMNKKDTLISVTNGILNSMECVKNPNLLDRIHALFLYNIYLEENSIINYVTNSTRLFSNFYSYIDMPTQLDLKTHNLLNCFGEIEVNYSNNMTSSGIIGVASTAVSLKKQEKQELTLLNKKQEAFMMDANLVCVKLASTHPFIFIRQLPMMEGLLQGRVNYTFEEFKRRKFDKLFHYIIDILNILVPFVFHRRYIDHVDAIISHYFDFFISYNSENREIVGGLLTKFVEFLEKFINSDLKVGHTLIIRKYSQFISFLQKTFPEISTLKYLNSIECIPFETASAESAKSFTSKLELARSISSNTLEEINIFNQKLNATILSSQQLNPFLNKMTNRDNYDAVLSVLQELDAVSQRQPIILSHFVFELQTLNSDPNDQLRDLSIALIMRYLRLNPRETPFFFQSFTECLNNPNHKVFNSAIKVFPDFMLLNSEKSSILIKSLLRGAVRHNTDVSKQLTDAIRLLQLEKYVY